MENNATLYYVYVYYDPFTNLPFYVGKGSGGRYKKHLEKTKRGDHYNKHLERKVAKILRNGGEPIIKRVFFSNDEQLTLDMETLLIKEYELSINGGLLCNCNYGGNFPVKSFTPQEVIDLLATMPDKDLADKFGLKRSQIRRERLSRGIKPFRPMVADKIEFSDEEKKLLGTMPDNELDELLGHKIGASRRQRDKLGIPSYASKSRGFEGGEDLRFHHFYKEETGEGLITTRTEFRLMFNIPNGNVTRLIKGERKRAGGWRYEGVVL